MVLLPFIHHHLAAPEVAVVLLRLVQMAAMVRLLEALVVQEH